MLDSAILRPAESCLSLLRTALPAMLRCSRLCFAEQSYSLLVLALPALPYLTVLFFALLFIALLHQPCFTLLHCSRPGFAKPAMLDHTCLRCSRLTSLYQPCYTIPGATPPSTTSRAELYLVMLNFAALRLASPALLTS